MAPHIERMKVEIDELTDRTNKLTAFLDGEVFAGLDRLNQGLLKAQLGAMLAYLQILGERFALATA